MISIYILIVWVKSAMEQIRLLAGHGAEPGFMKVQKRRRRGGGYSCLLGHGCVGACCNIVFYTVYASHTRCLSAFPLEGGVCGAVWCDTDSLAFPPRSLSLSLSVPWKAVSDTCRNFDERIIVDVIRAYHFGSDFLVEVEIVLDEHTVLRESHDLALALQVRRTWGGEDTRCVVLCVVLCVL